MNFLSSLRKAYSTGSKVIFKGTNKNHMHCHAGLFFLAESNLSNVLLYAETVKEFLINGLQTGQIIKMYLISHMIFFIVEGVALE
jgi:hypothetical protein